MQEFDQISKADPKSTTIDAVAIIKHLVRPLGYAGLTVMVLGLLGWRLLGSDLPPLLKTLSISLLFLLVTYCFKLVSDKIKNASELVLKAENHMQIAMMNSIQGDPLIDAIDDRIEEILAKRERTNISPAQSTPAKQKVNFKRRAEDEFVKKGSAE